MRRSTHSLLICVLCLVGILTIGMFSQSAGATTKTARVRENIHRLQVAVQSYAVDNNDFYPRYDGEAEFRLLLAPYLNSWPTNPYTHRPMRRYLSKGNYGYRTWDAGATFRLIGWGPQRRRLIIVP